MTTEAMQKLGLTPAKGALMALLAIGMVWVWSPMIFREADAPRRSAMAKKERPSALAPPQAPTITSIAADTEPTEEPGPPSASVEMTLSEATRHDPFATPAWAPKANHPQPVALAASGDALQRRFKELAANGVAMVLVSEEGQAAQIGDRTVQVGDVIEGFRVVEISAAGVKFEPDSGGADHGA